MMLVGNLSGAFSGATMIALGAWLYLFAGRGGFWRARPRLDVAGGSSPPADWPAVVAVVPARNEAAVIGEAVASLLGQDYEGPFRVVLVDDRSDDGTAGIARARAEALGRADRLDIVVADPLPPEWTGKMWAVASGVRRAEAIAPGATYLWITDADIVHHDGELRALAAKAEAERLDLASLMVRLHCRGYWERLLIPAFVFFFQKLYPFPWVNDRRRSVAAAAGGSMLVRKAALARAGGIAAVRDALIDDCALARVLKRHGPIWLGLVHETRSIRPYRRLGEIWNMVARSAYTQLGHSPLRLAATLAGLVFLYLVPPAAAVAGAVAGDAATAGLGFAAWLLMAAAYAPTLRLYRLSPAAALLLPLACLFYCGMTLDSARRHRRGRGAAWKGRVYGGPGLEAARRKG